MKFLQILNSLCYNKYSPSDQEERNIEKEREKKEKGRREKEKKRERREEDKEQEKNEINENGKILYIIIDHNCEYKFILI